LSIKLTASRACRLKKRLCGQFFSALHAPAGKHFPAVDGLHAFSEAMHLFPLSLFGLVCSKQADTPLSYGLKTAREARIIS